MDPSVAVVALDGGAFVSYCSIANGWAGAGPGLDETSPQRMIRTSWIV